jgi:N-acetylglucosamine-6-sulfatase
MKSLSFYLLHVNAISWLLGCLLATSGGIVLAEESERPNILFIFSDDHAVNAISAYGGPLKDVAPTPNIDQLAKEGALFQNSFCANSICGPSRACILTGKHSHKNGFMTNSSKVGFDSSQWTFIKEIGKAGYQTAVIGKWHLKSDPVGFDHWEILPGQGNYYNPVFIQQDGTKKQFTGYATDLTTDKAIDWLDGRDKSKPFVLMCQHKAPHRTFSPALRHLDSFADVEIPEPESLFDNYEGERSKTLRQNKMEIDRHFHWTYDLKLRKDRRQGAELPGPDKHGAVEYRRMNNVQKGIWDCHFDPLNQKFLTQFSAGELTEKQIVRWKYQRYMKNYLGTVKAVDESVGRLNEYLQQNGLAENTIVIYASDQGFYLGEHGWFDKRWMFEESLKMPFVIKWPGVVESGLRPDALIQNIDYAPTFLDMAGVTVPSEVQGQSIVPILKQEASDVRDSIYYAYYESGGEHNVPQHFGVRTKTHKLIHFPETKEWNLFDLESDPAEMNNVFGASHLPRIKARLIAKYFELRAVYEAPALPQAN